MRELVSREGERQSLLLLFDYDIADRLLLG